MIKRFWAWLLSLFTSRRAQATITYGTLRISDGAIKVRVVE